MEKEKFKLPPSLKGKVFLGDEFFKKKKESPRADFLLENLSHTERIETQHGAVIHRKITLHLNDAPSPEGYIFPGTANLRDLTPEALSLLSGEPEETVLDPSKLLFLDVETTGLAGGTGTYAFLCGIGYFEKGAFSVEQFFMEDYPCERAMLELLSKKIGEAEGFVTFNGKTFDIPLLSTRFIFNRMPMDCEIPHIDLLHPARRIWKGVLPDCRLESIEKEFFGLKRERDVEGSLIPQIYFDFIRGAHQEWMLPVFDHNVQDIATLGGLLHFFCRILSDPVSEDLKKPMEFWGLGKLFLKSGFLENAVKSLEHALSLAKEPDLIDVLLVHIGRLYKTQGKWNEAVSIWEKLADGSPTHSMSASIEIAKYYEHRERKPDLARERIVKSLKRIEMNAELEGYIHGIQISETMGINPDIEKRLRRLETKIQRKLKSSPVVEKDD
ncbi:ribonuclease H-like domain-containing protein [Candidatus Sumerlaeota bacterium]|nr:ribonuclease H-like domain-containing protein [Candidatus Sumerlaeota bacterium]